MIKFSVSVAEFNPFHNGHAALINKMKESGDAVVIIMSGNFCQRGEAAVLNKYVRARHAVLAGADVVIELPTVFATAPAEIFAKGAIKLLSGINAHKTLFFGTETGSGEEFDALAERLFVESKQFRSALKEQLATGAPYALARVNALKATEDGLNFDILDNPNSVLGLEYARAIKFFGGEFDIRPVKRLTDHNDGRLQSGGECSALAIRNAISDDKRKKIKPYVPQFVYGDLKNDMPDVDRIAIYKLLAVKAKDLKEIVDCTEGLENRIKALSVGADSVNGLIDRLETRRYTRARLARIVTANMLGINKALVDRALKSNMYLKVLAVAKGRKDVLSALAGGKHRLITRKADAEKLTAAARACFEKDAFACAVYNLATGDKCNPYEMKTVERE